MYGTVAKLRVKAGQEEKLLQQMREFETQKVPGFVGGYLYRLDGTSDEFMLAVAFTSHKTYAANADSPEQDARYRQFRELLAEDPDWQDGEILHPSGI